MKDDQWYVATLVIPIVGIGVGIYKAANNQVGQALAFWMTAFLSCIIWTLVIVAFANH